MSIPIGNRVQTVVSVRICGGKFRISMRNGERLWGIYAR